ncbi:MAG: tyrosine-protein phosphatase [Syntrophobacteraceae bacterium]
MDALSGKMIDFHCHILPGIDDGARDLDESVAMAKIAVEDGISGIVCTPHVSTVFPDNNRARVLDCVEQLRTRLFEEAIPLEIYPGSELAMDSDLGEKLESRELLSVNDNHNVALVEMTVDIIPPNIERFFWSVESAGIDIVLAHPERNPYLMKDPSRLLKWVQMGIMIQITASALEGKHGSRVSDFVKNLLRRRMVHLVASDAHSPQRQRPLLSKARAVAESVIGKEEARKIFCDNPRQLLLGNVPYLASPIEKIEKTSFLGRIVAFMS